MAAARAEPDVAAARRRLRIDARLAFLVAATVLAIVIKRDSPHSYFIMLVAIAAFWLVFLREMRGPRIRVRTLAVLSAGLLVVAIAMPPRQSRDISAYSAYGEMIATYHVSPYTHAPQDVLTGEVLERVNPRWRGSRTTMT